MKNYTILVTGCGGDIGQSLLKLLKKANFAKTLIGCDINEQHAGIFLCNYFVKVPRADSKNYKSDIINLINKYQIDIIIPSSEPELRHHVKTKIFHEISKEIKGIFIFPNLEVLDIGFDKFKTIEFLKKNDFPYPKTCLAEKIQTPSFPSILKDRYGAGGKNLFLIKNKTELHFYTQQYKNLIYQEFIPNTDGEFTCGLFKSKDTIRTIIFNRTLSSGGYSNYGVVSRHPQIESLLIKLALKLELNGSINVQLRLKENIPYIFEINPRFSSTVLFRHLLGFEDLVWAIQVSLGFDISSYSPVPEGSSFYKGFQEYISIP